MKDDRERLSRLLSQLRDTFDLFGSPVDSHRASALADSLSADRPVRVVILGEFNSGKSTLVNALCGADVLPTGIIPTTATINVVRHSTTPILEVHYTDGTNRNLPFGPETLKQFSARNGDQQDVREVRVGVPWLPDGLVLIDTPGVNDVNETRSEIVYEMIPEADALIFLMDIQQPLKRSETEFLRDKILGTSLVKTIFVLNHIDRVTNRGEIVQATGYVRASLVEIYRNLADTLAQKGAEQLSKRLRQLGTEIPVFTLSAKTILRTQLSSESLQGDPDGLRAEILGLAAPNVRMHSLLNGVAGQAFGLVTRLRMEVDHQSAMHGAECDRIVMDIRRNTEVLRTSLKAAKEALSRVEAQRAILRQDAKRAVEGVFKEALAVLDARIQQHGTNRGLQILQQEIGRNLEGKTVALNQRVTKLSSECASQAPAFQPVAAPRSNIETPNTNDSEPRRDWLAELLTNPVYGIGFAALAGGVVSVFGAPGLALVALPFVGRLLGGGSEHASIEQVRKQIAKSGEDAKSRISAALDERLDAISMAVLDALDEPQQRVRSSCCLMTGNGSARGRDLEFLQERAVLLESQVVKVTERLGETSDGSLTARVVANARSLFDKLGTE